MPGRASDPSSRKEFRMLDLLKGVRVVSFNHFLLGPMGMQALGDLGADVISIEAPDGAWQRHWSSGDIWHDGQGMLHLCANRNKRNIALDLKSAEGQGDRAQARRQRRRGGGEFPPRRDGEARLRLRRRSRRASPRLIYASASGYGPDGPYAERPGQDLLAQALFGMMAITGQAQTGPRPAGVSVIDHHGAALFALGICAALLRRAAHRPGLPGRCQPDAGGARPAGGVAHRLDQRAAEARERSTRSSMSPAGTTRRLTASTPRRTAISRSRSARSRTSARSSTSRGSQTFTEKDSWTRQDEITDLIAAKLQDGRPPNGSRAWSRRRSGTRACRTMPRSSQDPQVKHMQSLVTVPGAGDSRRAGHAGQPSGALRRAKPPR